LLPTIGIGDALDFDLNPNFDPTGEDSSYCSQDI